MGVVKDNLFWDCVDALDGVEDDITERMRDEAVSYDEFILSYDTLEDVLNKALGVEGEDDDA